MCETMNREQQRKNCKLQVKSVDLSDNVDDDNVWQIELPCCKRENGMKKNPYCVECYSSSLYINKNL